MDNTERERERERDRGRGSTEPGALWSEIEMAIGVRHAVIARNYGGKLKLPRSSGTPIVGTRDTVPR